MKYTFKNILSSIALIVTCSSYASSTDRFIRRTLRPLVPINTTFHVAITNNGEGIFALQDPTDNNILIVVNFNAATETIEDDLAFLLPSYGVTGDIENLTCAISNTGHRIVTFRSIADNTVRVLRYEPGTGWVNAIPAIYTSTEVLSNNYTSLANNGVGLIIVQESTGTTNTGSILTFVTTDFGANWTQVTFSETAVRLRDPHLQDRFITGNTQSKSFAINHTTGAAVLIYGAQNPILLRNPEVHASIF